MKQLLKILDQQHTESESSAQRNREQMRRNMEYYTLQKLGNEVKGRSQYISPDVHDNVESKKALFRETFLSSRDVAKFVSDGSTPPDEALAKTRYVNRVLEEADKAKLFGNFWHDSFVQKRGALLVEWVSDPQETSFTLNGAPVDVVRNQLQQIPGLQDIDESGLQAEIVQAFNQMGQPVTSTLLHGAVTAITDTGTFHFTLMQPERYLRDPQAAEPEDSMWHIYVDEVPRGTMERMGYDRTQVAGLSQDRQYRETEVDQSRKSHDRSHHIHQHMSRDQSQENITVYKTWTWINLSALEGTEYGEYPDEVRLYEIHWVHDEILKWGKEQPGWDGEYCIREVDELPIFEWSELRVPHAESNMCAADLVVHTQKANSQLKRGVIDNVNIRNNTRYEAVHDRLLNPRDLIDNKIGGVVFSDEIGSVAPLETPDLPAATMSVMQMLDMDNEKRSGMSSLAKGMNTDALRYQNSADMVERLTNAAKTRPMQLARDFAETFLVPLSQYIVRVAMQMDQSQTTMESGGRQIIIAPQSWQGDETSMDVVTALTPDEASDMGQKLLVMHQTIMMDPMLSQLYGVQQRHALFDDVFEAMGIQDTTRYLMRPDSPEFAQMMQSRQQMEQAQAMAEQAMMKFQQWLGTQQIDQGWAQINNTMLDKMEDNQREDRKVSIDKEQGDRDLDIKEKKVSAA